MPLPSKEQIHIQKEIYWAIDHNLRRRIIEFLETNNDISQKQLMIGLRIPMEKQNNLSQQLKTLILVGLVNSTGANSATTYSLNKRLVAVIEEITSLINNMN